MRILMDLQACVTGGSRQRGVGRYSESFARAVSQRSRDADVSFSLNGNFAASVHLGRQLRTEDPSVRISYYRYPTLTQSGTEARQRRIEVAEEIMLGHWASLHPDMLHVAHCFEGLHDEAVVPRLLPRLPGMFTSATLFDLIPLRFPEHYLTNPATRRWYLSKLGTLRQFDLLAAISETSRRDAIDLLGIPEHRVVTVWGGVDPQFSAKNVSEVDRALIQHRYDIRRPFLLYTGGDDFRKNLVGVMKAFSELPYELRNAFQFVVVCALSGERKGELIRTAETFGLSPHAIVFTQYVPEADLITLYRTCTAFIFPSLYEGLGLPVLEAMACGAPVIGSNNSAVKDLIARPDATFDPTRTETIVAKLAQILSNQDMRHALRQHGISRASQFTWAACADAYLSAVNELQKQALRHAAVIRARTLPRRRMALFSPLPPARSGIADHTSLLLPYLLQYFDLEVFVEPQNLHAELPLSVPVRTHHDFEHCWQSFDAVMFEMGNSEFHAYMLPWLRRFPGVVTLHDAYLSGLFAYADSSGDFSGIFSEEMLYSHGPRARRRLCIGRHKDPIWNAVLELPCTKSVLDNAIGVIAHSALNFEISGKHFPEGWPAASRIVPQFVIPKARVEHDHRALLRRDLGYAPDSFIVATFGHIAWTKCGDQLLDGFELAAAKDSRLHLVFVGALAEDDFGRALRERVDSSPHQKRIRVTGFVEPSEFENYLHTVDLAFQLRKTSRGETSKAVLDCLSTGLPVTVNNDASYRDYPSEALIKLGASPSATELMQSMLSLANDVKALRSTGEAGRRYVEAQHEPTAVAATYALTIHEFLERQHYASRNSRLRRLGDLARTDDHSGLQGEIATALDFEWRQQSFARQRLLVDVTHLSNEDHGTGIPRVVKSILQNLYVSERTGFEPIAVRLNDHGLLEEATGLMQQLDVLLSSESKSPSRWKITPRPGDILLLLDSSWGALDRYRPSLQSARAAGAVVVIVVYDLIPIRHPNYVPDGGAAWFRGWLEQALVCSDAAICISRATADDLIDFIRESNLPLGRPFRIGYWHLGADIGKAGAPIDSNDAIVKATRRPALLMVGTIEPRKRHQLALDAMEILWQRGVEVNLLIAGQHGWLSDHLMKRLTSHPELGQRLHMFKAADDATLQQLYQSSTALLFPSASEGFGLPLIEAAKFGLPIICSKIPAFKEVAGEHAFYADATDAESLAASIFTWLSLWPEGRAPDSRQIVWQSWEQSAEQLLDVVIDNHWYKTLEEVDT